MAGSHIRSGSKLLREAVYDKQNGTLNQHHTLKSNFQMCRYVPLDALADIFSGLDTQVAAVRGNQRSGAPWHALPIPTRWLMHNMHLEQIVRDYKFEDYQYYFSRNMESDDPSWVFSNIEEAKNIFEYGRYLLASSHPARPSSDTGKEFSAHALEDYISYCTKLLAKFSHSLQVFEETKGLLFTPREEIAIAVLRLHILNAYVSFHAEYLPLAYRLSKSQLLPQMTEMVLLGEKVISSALSNTYFESQTTSFCLDMGLVIPLYTVASQSPDTTIRRRAISLLRSVPRQEGLWHSLVVAKAAERIMEIEESQEGVQLRPFVDDMMWSASPGSRTILQVDGRGVRLQYERTGGGNKSHGGVVEEIMKW